MDHDHNLLNLSDVVHDEPVDDDDDQSDPHPGSHHSPTPDFDPTVNILSTLHDTYSMSEHSPGHLSSPDYAVDILEREIASLLNQNASAASAALLNAAAQQRQSSIELSRSNPGACLDATQPNGESSSGLAPTLSGLVAVLQAMQARVGTEEGRDGLGKGQRQTTRTAPAFHSLTASDTRNEPSPSKKRRRERASNGEHPAYLFSEDERDSDSDTLGGAEGGHSTPQEHPVMAYPTPPSVSNSINDLPPVPVPGEFSDINDILNQFSAQFDPNATHSPPHGSSTPDVSPVISHARTVERELSMPSQSPLPVPSALPVLVPSNRIEQQQPIASTSFAPSPPSMYDASKKAVRKSKDKERGPNSHTCDHENCHKTFTRRSDLARHTRIHTGERPFVCTYANCGKTFIQRSALHVHSRVHTGEKPHCCEYPGCGKTFGDSSSLARHRRTHTGKRPYKCQEPTCEKTFTRRTTLTTHMRTHDPSWELDPNVKYNFKGKKRKIDEEEDLEESVRAISALLQAGSGVMTPGSVPNQDLPLEAHVASISAEIAAAIAQARSRGFQDDDDDDDDDDEGEEESGSGQDLAVPETIGPNTSGIRGLDTGEPETVVKDVSSTNQAEQREDEDDDSDAFPQPLHSRKMRESVPATGTKRKR